MFAGPIFDDDEQDEVQGPPCTDGSLLRSLVEVSKRSGSVSFDFNQPGSRCKKEIQAFKSVDEGTEIFSVKGEGVVRVRVAPTYVIESGEACSLHEHKVRSGASVRMAMHYDEIEVDCDDNGLHNILCGIIASRLPCPNFARIPFSDAFDGDTVVELRTPYDEISLLDVLRCGIHSGLMQKLHHHVVRNTAPDVMKAMTDALSGFVHCKVDRILSLTYYALLDNLIRQFTMALIVFQQQLQGMLLDFDPSKILVHLTRPSDDQVQATHKYMINGQAHEIPNLGVLLVIRDFTHANIKLLPPRMKEMGLDPKPNMKPIVLRQDVLLWKGRITPFMEKDYRTALTKEIFDPSHDITFMMNYLSYVTHKDTYLHPLVTKFFDEAILYNASSDDRDPYGDDWLFWFARVDRSRWMQRSSDVVDDFFQHSLRIALPPDMQRMTTEDYYRRIRTTIELDTPVRDIDTRLLKKHVSNVLRDVRGRRTSVAVDGVAFDRLAQGEDILYQIMDGIPTSSTLVMDAEAPLDDILKDLVARSEAHPAYIAGGRQGQVYKLTAQQQQQQQQQQQESENDAVVNEVARAGQMFSISKDGRQMAVKISHALPVDSQDCRYMRTTQIGCTPLLTEIIITRIMSLVYSQGICPNFFNMHGAVRFSTKPPVVDALNEENVKKQVKSMVQNIQLVQAELINAKVDVKTDFVTEILGHIHDGSKRGLKQKIIDIMSLPWTVIESFMSQLSWVFRKGASYMSVEKERVGIFLEYIDADLSRVDDIIIKVQQDALRSGVPRESIPPRQEFIDNIMLQVMCALYTFQRMFRGMHNDLHIANIFIKICDDTPFNGKPLIDHEYWSYRINGKEVHVPNLGVLVKLGDFGHSSMTLPRYPFQDYLKSLYQQTTASDDDRMSVPGVEISKKVVSHKLILMLDWMQAYYSSVAEGVVRLIPFQIPRMIFLGLGSFISSTVIRSQRLYRPSFDLGMLMNSLLCVPSLSRLRILRHYWCVEKAAQLERHGDLQRFDMFVNTYASYFMHKFNTMCVPLDTETLLTRPEDMLNEASIQARLQSQS